MLNTSQIMLDFAKFVVRMAECRSGTLLRMAECR